MIRQQLLEWVKPYRGIDVALLCNLTPDTTIRIAGKAGSSGN